MAMTRAHLAVVVLLLAPLLWLWPCVFGDRTFVSYDLAQFPPAGLLATPTQLAAAQDGANFDVTELPVWFVPELRLAHDELAAGRLPTWNPNARGGAPLHAHGLIGLCYPPNWIALCAAEPARRLGLVAWIDVALAGLLAFGLLRRAGLPTLPAWFGALLFELSAPVAANALFWMRLGSYVWLPGVLWAILATAQAERMRPRHAAALGGAFAMTWLAGFPPFAAATTVLGGWLALWLVVAAWRAGGVAAARRLAGRLALGFALGGCWALPQVLPSLQFFPQSARETKPEFQRIAEQSFESYGLLGFLLPDALGHPSDTAAVPYRGQNPLALLLNTRQHDGRPTEPNFNYTEYAVFVGQLGLLLAIVGALAGRGGMRAFALSTWLGCAGLALFLPLVRLLFLLPLVENVWPLRWLAPATLFVAWLAALGLQRLLTSGRALPLTLAGAAAALAIAAATVPAAATWTATDSRAFAQRLADKYGLELPRAVEHVQHDAPAGTDRFAAAYRRFAGECARAAPWLAGAALWFLAMALRRDERSRRWLAVTAGLATALQLGVHGSSLTRGVRGATDIDTPVQAFLREQARAHADEGGFMIARGSTETPVQLQLPPGALLVRGVRDLHFYSHFDGRSLRPLQALLGKALGARLADKGYLTGALPDTVPPPSLERLFANGTLPRDQAATAHPFQHPLLDLLGVRFVLATENLPHAGTVVGPAVSGPGGTFFVHERRSALPRAFAVADVAPHAHDADVVQALLAPDFAPRAMAHALADDLPATRPAAAPPAPGSAPRPVRFTRDEPTHVELDVGAGNEPWLLLTDTFLPGWTAAIDGDDAPVHRADHAFRLVALPPAACRVSFRYRAPGLAAGTALAAFATVAWLLWWNTTRRRRRVDAAAT